MPGRRSTVNAPLRKFIAADEASAADRRREPRHSTCFEATLEFSNGTYTSALLADVSLHGCCIRADADSLRQGAFVSIGLGAEPKIPAIVRWVRGNAAGMEFLRQVPIDRRDWHALIDNGLGA
jgi:hypothetical protein